MNTFQTRMFIGALPVARWIVGSPRGSGSPKIRGAEICSQLGAGVHDFRFMIRRMICFQTWAHSRFCSAHWPAPLTASGTAIARPSCLPSPANQLILGNSCPDRPIERSVRLALVSSQLGSLNFPDPSTGALENRVSELLQTPSRLTVTGHLGGRFPGPNDRRDSTFSRKKYLPIRFRSIFGRPPRVRHASEGCTFLQKQPQT